MKKTILIKKCICENLSGLYVSQQQHIALMNKITGETKMKRKLTVSLVLTTILVLLAAAAIAWGLRYSPEASAISIAKKAIMDKYTLSQAAMDMFFAHTDAHQQGITVHFKAYDIMGDELKQAGTYTVQISDENERIIQWSHDDVSPSVWADGSLEAPVWGDQQILAYRTARDKENEQDSKKLAENEIALVSQTDAPSPQSAGPQGKHTETQVLAMTHAAMKAHFSFSDATLSLFDTYACLATSENQALRLAGTAAEDRFESSSELEAMLHSFMNTSQQQEPTWVVLYLPGHLANALLYREAAHPMGCYAFSLSDETGEILHSGWSLEGKEGRTFTQQTWGQATAYRADLLPWVLDLASTCYPLIEKGEAQGTALSVEDNAIYDKAFLDAGFDADDYNHVLPLPGELSYEQAVELTAQVLQEEFGVSRSTFDASGFAYADLTQEKEGRQWYFWVQNLQEQCGWSVTFNAETGEVLSISSDPFANSNG